MNYTILKQWKTLSGEYHSTSSDYSSYDSAIGNFHSMWLPMMNDSNVASFSFTLLDEDGNRIKLDKWARQIEDTATE